MPAAAASALASENTQEVTDFLRRLAGMMAGGRNAEQLLDAAGLIEALTRRAASAEQLFRDLQEDHTKNLELREVAELAGDNLIAEMAQLRTQLADNERRAEDEIALLKQQLAERETEAERDRAAHAEEALRLQAIAQEAQVQLSVANAMIDELGNPVGTTDDSVAIVPMQALQTARDQFAYLAHGFAKSGDLISQTICEVGACAIDKALAGNMGDQG